MVRASSASNPLPSFILSPLRSLSIPDLPGGDPTSAWWVGSVIDRPPGSAACCHQLAGDRPGLIRGQEDRDERDLRSVHHAADGIAARRVRSEVLPLRLFRGYAQLGGAGGAQARRALGAGRAGMDAIDRDPMAGGLER